MVAVRSTRLVGQTIAELPPTGGATRQTVEVAASANGASAQAVRVTRIVGQVLGKIPSVVGATRQTVEVAASANAASAQAVLVTRLVGQVLARNAIQGGVTRQTLEVAASANALSSQPALVTRLAGQAISRLRSLPTVPLALPAEVDLFLHNWVNAVEMQTTYLTDVVTSPPTAAEERRGLVPRPTRTIKFRWSRNSIGEIDRVLVSLRRLASERTVLPIYQDYSVLLNDVGMNDTTIMLDTSRGRFSPGGRFVLMEIDFEQQYTGRNFIRQIVTMQSGEILMDASLGEDISVALNGSSWLALPLMDIERGLRVEGLFKNGELIDVELDATEVQGPSALPPWSSDIPPGVFEFRGYPIWQEDLDWSDDLEFGYDQAGESTSSGRGEIIYLSGDRPRYSLKPKLSGDRDLGIRTIKFLDSRLGRLRSWWQIDEEGIWVALAFQASGDFIDVEPLGDFDDFVVGFDFVGVEMRDGTRYVREVVSNVDQTTSWRLTVTPQLPINLQAANVVRVSRARLVRNISDTFKERWQSDGMFETDFETIQVLEEGSFSL